MQLTNDQIQAHYSFFTYISTMTMMMCLRGAKWRVWAALLEAADRLIVTFMGDAQCFSIYRDMQGYTGIYTLYRDIQGRSVLLDIGRASPWLVGRKDEKNYKPGQNVASIFFSNFQRGWGWDLSKFAIRGKLEVWPGAIFQQGGFG